MFILLTNKAFSKTKMYYQKKLILKTRIFKTLNMYY